MAVSTHASFKDVLTPIMLSMYEPLCMQYHVNTLLLLVPRRAFAVPMIQKDSMVHRVSAVVSAVSTLLECEI